MLMSNFTADNLTGKHGEYLVQQTLTKRGHTVKSVASDREYQRKDIDFLVRRADGLETTLEIKTDCKSQTTNNVYIETWCVENVSRHGKGWFYYCEADYIGFVQPDLHLLHIVDYQELKNLIKNNYFKSLTKYDGTAQGLCVPITALAQLGSYQLIPII